MKEIELGCFPLKYYPSKGSRSIRVGKSRIEWSSLLEGEMRDHVVLQPLLLFPFPSIIEWIEKSDGESLSIENDEFLDFNAMWPI